MCFSVCSEGHYSVAKLILDSNAKVNVPSGSENNIPLTLACWKGSVLEFYQNVILEGSYKLANACQKSSVVCVVEESFQETVLE